MKKWIVLAVVAFVLLVGYVAAGPLIAVHGIRSAIESRDIGALDDHVDFPAVRRSLKDQVEGELARRAGGLQDTLLGALGLRLAGNATDALVDMLATPVGIAAVLEGRNVVQRFVDNPGDAYAPVRRPRVLDEPEYRYESPSRFTATVRNADGDPVVFVFTRDGLTWKLTEIRVPFAALLTGLRL